jgi:predicted histone-like DNA-binding protein
MSKLFSVWKKKFKNANGETIEKYYACPKTLRTVDTEELAMKISETSSLTPSDVLGCLRALSDKLEIYLTAGNNVKLDGIGTFGVGVTSDGFDDPKKINPKKVRASKVTYIADKKLINTIKKMKFSKEPKLPKGIVAKRSKK